MTQGPNARFGWPKLAFEVPVMRIGLQLKIRHIYCQTKKKCYLISYSIFSWHNLHDITLLPGSFSVQELWNHISQDSQNTQSMTCSLSELLSVLKQIPQCSGVDFFHAALMFSCSTSDGLWRPAAILGRLRRGSNLSCGCFCALCGQVGWIAKPDGPWWCSLLPLDSVSVRVRAFWRRLAMAYVRNWIILYIFALCLNMNSKYWICNLPDNCGPELLLVYICGDLPQFLQVVFEPEQTLGFQPPCYC